MTNATNNEILMLFKQELEHIKDDKVRAAAQEFLKRLPDYFLRIPASSTGKYHPSYTQGEGGLVRHTIAAVRIAIDLLRLEMYAPLSPYNDYIILALMLHDGWKLGRLNERGEHAQYTRSEHPKICHDWILEQTDLLTTEERLTLASLVLTHMGQWNMAYGTGMIFAPKPTTMTQCFVHTCDYLASRKTIEFNFDVPFGV